MKSHQDEWEDETIALSAYPDNNPKTELGEAKPKISDTPPIAIRELGQVMSMGAKKYGAFNWREKRVSSTVYYDAAWRHLSAWFEGRRYRPRKWAFTLGARHGVHGNIARRANQ